MNNIANQLLQTKEAKLSAENTALNNCKSDMSDVNFEITESSYSIKLFGLIILFALFFGGRIGLRRMAGNPDYTMSVIDKAFWIFIVCLAIFTFIYAIVKKFSKGITVAGKTIFYNGNCWTSDEISEVECTVLNQIKVYSEGKKVLSFSWERNNSEMFIAWVRKCGISFDDKRKNL